jgi:hypothetical protein
VAVAVIMRALMLAVHVDWLSGEVAGARQHHRDFGTSPGDG